MKTELEYWDKAAEDPEVNQKYICDVDTDECLAAIMPYLEGRYILEIGCGVGRLTSRLCTSSEYGGCQIHGIDISAKMLELAEEHTPWKAEAQYKVCDGRTIPKFECCRKIGSDHIPFDSVYSMLTFQHIDNQNVLDYFYEAARVLRKDGVFRFQYVEGNYHGFVDHNHDTQDVKRWLDNSGFEVKTIDKGLIKPHWTWITAVRK